jgi:hypothetical protein
LHVRDKLLEMLTQILRTLLVTVVALVALFIWLLLVLAVARDARRRDLPRGDRWFWVSLAIALPLVGYVDYLLARGLNRLIGPEPAAAYAAPLAGESRPNPVLITHTGAGERAVVETQPGAALRSTPQPAAWVLSAVSGPAVGQRFSVGDLPARIGRGPDAHVRLDADRSVSRRHADLYRAPDGLHIRDLGSRSGTLVNGLPVLDSPLRAGDRVMVGESLLLVQEIQGGAK